MTNTHGSPNRLSINGAATIGLHFGHLHSLIAVNPVWGHPHGVVRFVDGVCFTLCPCDLVEVYRRLPTVLSTLGISPDVSGSAWGAET